MRLLLIGDIVGKPGRQIVGRAVKPLIEREQLDLVVANGENSAGGSGITPAIYHELIAAGVDVVTLGDHIYRRAEITEVLEQRGQHRQAGQLSGRSAGREFAVVKARNGVPVAVFSLLGRVFMRPVDCPFKAADRVLAAIAERSAGHPARFPRRGHQRQAIDGPLPRRPRVRRAGHAHPRADRRRVHPARRHGVSVRRGHDRPVRKHSGPPDRSGDGNHAHLQSHRLRRRHAATCGLCGTIVEVDPATGRATAIRRLVAKDGELG